MAAETGAAGSALIKWIGAPLFLGALAAALGFLIIPSRSRQETVMRIFFACIGSAIVGPLLFFWFISWQSAVVPTAIEQTGLPAGYVWLMLSAPFLLAGGLPFWWLLGATLRWFDKRRGKDLGEMARDAKQDFWP